MGCRDALTRYTGANTMSNAIADPSLAPAGSNVDSNTQSLLNVVVREYNKDVDARCSRLLLLGRVGSGNVEHLLSWHEDYCQSKRENAQQFTGVFFLVSETTVAHVLEAPTRSLLSYLRVVTGTPAREQTHDTDDREQKSTSGQPLISDARVVVFTEEVLREFPVWYGTRVQREKGDDYVVPAKMDFATFSFHIHKRFLEMGRQISRQSDPLEFMMKNQDQLLEDLPTAEEMAACINHPDVCRVDEYLDIFDSPVDYVLESEKVWPVEPSLKYSRDAFQ